MDQVRSRVERDRTRLDAGQVSSPRELENLQSEIVSLARRQSDLEEIVLDVMERQEAAELPPRRRSRRSGRHSPASATRSPPGGTRRSGRSASRRRRPGSLRAGVAADVPADLLDLYGKLRAQHGVGAAALRARAVRGLPPVAQHGRPGPHPGRRRRTRCSAARNAAGSWSAPRSPACDPPAGGRGRRRLPRESRPGRVRGGGARRRDRGGARRGEREPSAGPPTTWPSTRG